MFSSRCHISKYARCGEKNPVQEPNMHKTWKTSSNEYINNDNLSNFYILYNFACIFPILKHNESIQTMQQAFVKQTYENFTNEHERKKKNNARRVLQGTSKTCNRAASYYNSRYMHVTL